MDSLLFKLAYGLYTLSTLLYVGYLFSHRPKLSRAAFWILLSAVMVHAGSFASRTLSARDFYAAQSATLKAEGNVGEALMAEKAARTYVPWNNWFETLSFLGAVISVVYLVIAWNSPIPLLGSFIMGVSWIFLTLSLLRGKALPPLDSLLQSGWLALHIPVMMASYSLLTIASAVALAYLIAERQMKRKHPTAFTFQLPSLDQLDGMMAKLVYVSLPLLTTGLLTGGVWAHVAWGDFWAWDPKETWALITWMIYAGYLGLRVIRGWRGRKGAYVSIVGFASILFTFIAMDTVSRRHGFLLGAGQ
jgi:cytochrome c-type biogenesis protein CcsB